MKRRSREGRGYHGYGIWISCGLLGSLVFFALLFTAAFLSDSYSILFTNKAWTARTCLAFGSLVSGWTAAKNASQKRLLNACAGEGVLLLIVFVCVLMFQSEANLISCVLDIGIMFFGAFAGSLFGTARKKLQKGMG